jgi:7,8-dihydropterin-6-yl-methyl-4-(beta-D-ribofuranosyl)aminobenzene 5'-phosphate synthase
MKIQLIADGFSKWHRFIRRWGISFLIGEEILFDTFGDLDVFLKNIRNDKTDLSKIRHIVISHDDWDHIAGLRYITNRCPDLSVYICPNTHPQIKKMLNSYKVKVIEANTPASVTECVYTTGELRGTSKGRIIYEQSLVIKTSSGLAVLCGCAHPNVLEIVQFVKEKFKENVIWLIGGFHLKDNDDETNAKIIRNLQLEGVSKIIPLHCTGKQAQNIIKKIFGDDYVQLKEGQMLEL